MGMNCKVEELPVFGADSVVIIVEKYHLEFAALQMLFAPFAIVRRHDEQRVA